MTGLRELLSYARKVKNTRLVLFFREKPEDKLLRFLRLKHRHREIAVIGGKLRGSCFRDFSPPLEITLPVKDPLAGKALSASLFLISPLLMLQPEEEMEKFLIWRRYGSWEDLSDLLRHIRIAEYAMTDALEGDITPVEAVRDGEKRFWRLKPHGTQPLVDYLRVEGFLVVALYLLDKTSPLT